MPTQRLWKWLILVLLVACESKSNKDNEATTEVPEKSTVETKPQFTKLTSEQTGIYFINEVAENRFRNILLYQYFYNGGGVAAGDIDNDGKTDLFFTGNTVSNKLYRNQGNRGAPFQFEDISITAGILPLGNSSWCTGVTMADVNADGWLDIYVSRSGNLKPENRENLLYINQQNGTFVEQAKEYGLNDPGYSVQAAFFDYDRDGDLDMFLVNHGMETYTGRVPSQSSQRVPYMADKLFQNDEGKFTEVSEQAGIIGTQHSYGLGLTVSDVNRDGWDDIYVANDFYEHDYLYLNKQDGTFEETIHEATRQISFFGMGVDMADFNNDLWPDIMVVDMAAPDHFRQKSNLAGISDTKFWDFVDKGYHYQYMYNSLQLNNPLPPNSKQAVSFSNISRLAGVDQTDWSWAPLFADLDNDGWQDLFITNGLRKDVLNNDFVAGINQELEAMNARFVELNEPAAQSLLNQMPSQKIANYVYHNQGDLHFKDVSKTWGLGEPTFSNGAAYADLNNDGYLDLIINNLDDFPVIYRNQPASRPANYLRIKLKGSTRNRFGVGAKVTIYYQGVNQMRQLQPTRGFQSSVEPLLHFGLGESTTVDSLRIVWPDGAMQNFTDVAANQILTIAHADAKESSEPLASVEPLMQEITEQIDITFQHRESNYNDFDREFLLLHKLSDFGPALAVGDVNGDNLDDFFVGGAKGQTSQLFLQTSGGNFRSTSSQLWQQHSDSEATDALFFDADGDQDLDLYVVNGSNEYEVNDPALQDQLYLNDSQGNFKWAQGALPEMFSFSTCVTANDMDRDGDLDVFVGGYVLPGKYPQSAPSYVLENQSGTFTDATQAWLPENSLPGLITDAEWISEDELAVIGTWMNPTILRIENNSLVPTNEFDSIPAHGWWFSLVTADWNQDGNNELLLGNVGENYRYSASTNSPFELYAHDFDVNGSTDLLFGRYENGKLYTVEERDRMYQQLPSIKRKYTDYASYAQATLPEMIDETGFSQAKRFIAEEFHSLYVDRGKEGVSVRPLPAMAQLSAVRTVLTMDVNQDGYLDAVVAGNLYKTETRTPRLDASVGLVMLGDGQGNFKPLTPRESGFYASGDVRKIAKLRSPKGDLILVSNNNGPLQLFRLAAP